MNNENTAQRLQEAAAKCLSSLNQWTNDLKDRDARENLLDSVHELRKVTSRLELDIAINDRKATNSNPIPIPEHKSKLEKKKRKPLNDILPVEDIKAAKAKKKIEIEAAQQDDDAAEDNEVSPQDETQEDASKPRRGRRKKREDNDE
jgi:hypothetical protein